MKSIFRSGFFFIALAVLFMGTAFWYLFFDGKDGKSEQHEDFYFCKTNRLSSSGNGLKNRPRKPSAVKTPAVKTSVQVGQTRPPNIALSSSEDAQLTEEMRKIYQELQKALDDEDKARVFALVRKLQSMKEWPDGIPQSVKMHALDALAWFGGAGMAEAVGFLADGDQEVVNTTIEKFEEMLSDFELGDTGMSEILSQIVKVVHDQDALDTFYMEMNNMRDTVKAKTALNVFDSGNKDAISVLEENLEFIFSDADYDVKTREDVEKFLMDAEQAYKDDPEKAQDDEDFYGPPKD